MSQLIITYTNIVWYVNKTPPPSDRIFGKFLSLCPKYWPCLVKNYRLKQTRINHMVN